MKVLVVEAGIESGFVVSSLDDQGRRRVIAAFGTVDETVEALRSKLQGTVDSRREARDRVRALLDTDPADDPLGDKRRAEVLFSNPAADPAFD